MFKINKTLLARIADIYIRRGGLISSKRDIMKYLNQFIDDKFLDENRIFFQLRNKNLNIIAKVLADDLHYRINDITFQGTSIGEVEIPYSDNNLPNTCSILKEDYCNYLKEIGLSKRNYTRVIPQSVRFAFGILASSPQRLENLDTPELSL